VTRCHLTQRLPERSEDSDEDSYILWHSRVRLGY
jgi:hypothetical protein